MMSTLHLVGSVRQSMRPGAWELTNADLVPPPVKTCPCCARQHDDASWRALPFVGLQRLDADESGPAETYELRNCACGSTIARTVLS